MGTARYSGGSAGTQTAGLIFGGTPPVTSATEEYDGTNWTAGPNINIAPAKFDAYQGAFGSQTDAVFNGGSSATTVSYNGTTATVAKKLGRNYYGIEKEKSYFKAAEERLKNTKPIEDDLLDTLKNNRSKPRVPFGSLVEMGLIKPGTQIFDQKKKNNAKINSSNL